MICLPTPLLVALCATSLEQVPDMDGESFLPLLEGQQQAWRTSVFTEYNETFYEVPLHMRAIQNEDFGYIYNAFYGREKVEMEASSGPTWDAMVEAGRTDPAIQARVDLFYSRVPEELYNYKTDPDALGNLVVDPTYADILAELRQQLANEMYRTDDFMLERFEEELGVKGVEG